MPHLQPRSRIEALNNLGVVKEAVGSVPDGYHPAAATVDVDAVHVAKCQADVRGRLREDGEALVGSVGALGQTEHGHCWQLVDGIQWRLGVIENLGRRAKGQRTPETTQNHQAERSDA